MFNYFIHGVTKETVAPGDKLDHAYLASIGLGETLADLRDVPADATVLHLQRPAGQLPGKLTSGVCIAPVRKVSGAPQVTVDLGLQRWKPANGGKYWIGWLESDRPAVRDLQRKELVAGEDVNDEQGNAWKVPIARAPQWNHPFGTLPQSYTFDELGNPVPKLMARFQWLWDLSGEIQDWYRSNAEEPPAAQEEQEAGTVTAPKKKVPFTRLVQYAARILAVNYRVSFVELAALHERGIAVLTNSTVHAICQASYGWQIEDEAKKKPPIPSTSDPPNCTPSTTGGETPSAAPGTSPAAADSSRPECLTG